MIINEARKIVETDRYIKDLLADGEFVSYDDITNYIKDLILAHDFNKPFFDSLNHTVEGRERSSASNYNDYLSTMWTDLNVLYKIISHNFSESAAVFNKNYLACQLLLTRINKLRGKIEGLVLRGALGGYLAVIDDPLVSLENIDIPNTTAAVDPANQSVTINHLDTDGNSTLRKIDVTGITSDDVSFNVIGTSNLVSSSAINATTLLNALSEEARPWQHQVVLSSPSGVTCEYRLRFPELIELNKIVFKRNFPSPGGATTVKVLYSTNGAGWQSIPSTTDVFIVSDSVPIVFPTTEVRHIKFIFTKQHWDTKPSPIQFVYEIGANIIEFYKLGFSATGGNVLQTLPMSAQNSDGDDISFSSVACEVCSEVDASNYINYEVSFDSGTTFLPISPANAENAIAPKVVHASATTQTTITDKTTFKYDDDWADLAFDGKDNANNIPINYNIPANYFNDNLEIYRNTGSQNEYPRVEPQGGDTYVPALIFEGLGVAPGWAFDGAFYSTYAYVSQPSGLTVDFGQIPCYINGIAYTGITVIPHGVNYIKVNKLAYSHPFNSTFNGNFLMSDVVGEEYNESTKLGEFTCDNGTTFYDRLYPYNHRLIIEGITYSAGASIEVKKYPGAQWFAGESCKRVSLFDFKNNHTASNVFTVVSGLWDYNQNPDARDWQSRTWALVKKRDDVWDNDPQNEKYLFSVTANSDDTDPVTSVVLKATLQSNNSSSPVLRGIRLRLGD